MSRRYVIASIADEYLGADASPYYGLVWLADVQQYATTEFGTDVSLELDHSERVAAGWRCVFRVNERPGRG